MPGLLRSPPSSSWQLALPTQACIEADAAQGLTNACMALQDSATDVQSSSTKQLASNSSHFQTMIESKAAMPKTFWMQLRPACAGPLDEHMPVIAIPSFVKSLSNAACPSTLFFASLKPMDQHQSQVHSAAVWAWQLKPVTCNPI